MNLWKGERGLLHKSIVLLLQLPDFWLHGCQECGECRHSGSAFRQCVCSKVGIHSKAFTSHLSTKSPSLLHSHFKIWGVFLTVFPLQRERIQNWVTLAKLTVRAHRFLICLLHSKSYFWGIYPPYLFVWHWSLLSPVTHSHPVASNVSKWMHTKLVTRASKNWY